MKDAKGHGSNGRGGPASYQNVSTKPLVSNAARDRMAAASHSSGIQGLPANMTRQHFVMIANMLKEQATHTDPATHKANVSRYADQLSTTNPRFDRNRFTKAAGG